MRKTKTFAIVNDPKVTLGSLPSEIELLNAWDINWSDLAENEDYIVLGGHMGAYDENEFEYLVSEKKWLNKIVNSGTKVLGICLGSQLIADSLGGKAYLSKNIEFGFKNLNFVNNQNLFDPFKSIKVFTWHRDTFDTPPNAKLIAKTDFPQIFTYKNSISLQFHPEINLDLFESWYSSQQSKDELTSFDVESERTYLKTNQNMISNAINEFYYLWKNL